MDTAETGNQRPTRPAAEHDRSPAVHSAGQTDLAHLVDRISDLVCVLRDDGVLVFVSPAVQQLLGFAPDEVIGRNFLEFLHPDEVPRALRVLAASVSYATGDNPATYRFVRADGGTETLQILGTVLTDDERGRTFAVTVRRDPDTQIFHEVIAALIANASGNELLPLVLQLAGWQGVLYRYHLSWADESTGEQHRAGDDLAPSLIGLDPATADTWERVGRTNTAAELTPAELGGAAVADAADAGVHRAWIVPVAHGGPTPAVLTVWTLHADATFDVAEYSVRMLTQLAELILGWQHYHDGLRWAAHHDHLTGLANRAAFFDALADHTGTTGAIVHLDLDGFKPVNDTHGHLVGDAVLAEVATRVRDQTAAGDIVARLGGDELAVLRPGADGSEAAALAERIRRAVATPVVAGDGTVGLTASVGVAAGILGEQLLDAADRGQLEAKRAGGDRVRTGPDG